MTIEHRDFKRGVVETIYTCNQTGLKVRKLKDSISGFDTIYIIASEKQYAVTEECADALVKHFK